MRFSKNRVFAEFIKAVSLNPNPQAIASFGGSQTTHRNNKTAHYHDAPFCFCMNLLID